MSEKISLDSSDTWEEIRTGKKYWFRETVCQSTDIQFPDGFKYMEESDAENP